MWSVWRRGFAVRTCQSSHQQEMWWSPAWIYRSHTNTQTHTHSACSAVGYLWWVCEKILEPESFIFFHFEFLTTLCCYKNIFSFLGGWFDKILMHPLLAVLQSGAVCAGDHMVSVLHSQVVALVWWLLFCEMAHKIKTLKKKHQRNQKCDDKAEDNRSSVLM